MSEVSANTNEVKKPESSLLKKIVKKVAPTFLGVVAIAGSAEAINQGKDLVNNVTPNSLGQLRSAEDVAKLVVDGVAHKLMPAKKTSASGQGGTSGGAGASR